MYYAVKREPKEQRKKQKRIESVSKEAKQNETRTKIINRERKVYQENQ